MFYISFSSASVEFIAWLRGQILRLGNVKGHVTKAYVKNFCYQLKYSKHEAVRLVALMYDGGEVFLQRKKLKINESLGMMKLDTV